MFDETLARTFQRRYLEGERGAIGGLYAECRRLAESLARRYIFKRGLSVADSAIEDAAAVSVSRILGRYRSSGYQVRSFYRTISLEVIHELSKGGPKARFVGSFVRLEAEPEAPPDEPEISLRSQVEDLLGEPNGKRIFLDLALNRSFRDACISIAPYVTPDRILTESRKLREIHRVIHGKDKTNGKPGRNAVCRDPKADSGDQLRPPQGKQADSLQGRG